jgi:hypothetical protein
MNSVTETELIKPNVNWKTYSPLTGAKWRVGGISTNMHHPHMVGDGCSRITGKKSGNLTLKEKFWKKKLKVDADYVKNMKKLLTT